MNYVKIDGGKNLIVFLHGWGMDSSSFLFAKDYFLEYAKVFVDFAGFGKTPPPKRAWFVEDYAKNLYDFLKGFEFENLVLVGHSFGGRVAVRFAAKYQNEFSGLKLCLVDSAGIKPRLSLLKKLKIAKFKRLKKKSEKNEKLKRKLESFGSSDYKNLLGVMRETFVRVVNEDLSQDAAKILCDTQIVWGEKDKETKLFMAKKYHKLIKNSKLDIISNAGHFCFLEKPQEFLIILDRFLKKN